MQGAGAACWGPRGGGGVMAKGGQGADVVLWQERGEVEEDHVSL